ncbi:MAG: DUF4954 family protein [Prolixibacteraceae bacterium]|jgi:hypothetical protein|nr:DUF4954 family protein [Prolixibacteraceae bacterium]MBT6006043.1 DUF4954 family protein [Prolixibacteraceae bacterium]MBT6763265.1 DUF4954 family protein [Prolixibacteraceae bacterium]MBT6999173.1 DUF4954 family protein [Prolixibacteraceae bacterium]MBT7395251.1 DUF4954 family protein [Prolixibacteraceae bacterium]
MSYRNLTNNEITALKQQGCFSIEWASILVNNGFKVNTIYDTQFAGEIKLGSFTGNVELEKGISKQAGIRNSYIENCVIGDNVYLSNIGSLVNYNIGDKVAIENVGTIAVTQESTFGNGHEIEVLNEGGGRELPIFDQLSAQIAYLLVVYRHNKPLTEKLKKLVKNYVDSKKSLIGNIGDNTKILHSKSLINVNIGAYSKIRGVSVLEEGTIVSSRLAPTIIGEGVVGKNFIVLSGSKIDSGAIFTSTFIGQGVQIGKQFSAENSAFFANCEGFHGEACSIFAGPYTVTHHKSTLLIAGMFSFYNAGSGTNQSNHMYKLGPIHQGIVERGAKTSSFSYMLWPCRVGAFSVVMDKHAANFDTSELPFSYISVQNGKSVVTPAMNLFTVGTARDSKKWPTRDRRTDTTKLDLINFELLNPVTVQKIIDGSNLLAKLHETAPKNREFVTHKGAYINRLMLRTSKRYYDLAINVYLAEELIKRLKKSDLNSLGEIREKLTPKLEPQQNKWVDILGMVADKTQIENLTDSLIEEKINSIDDLLSGFEKLRDEYENRAYSWTVATIKKQLNIDVEIISKEQLLKIVSEWKTNSIKFNNMILKDAEKEFDQLSKIGFGPDGGEDEKFADFEAIRGNYETNTFIIGLKNESDKIESVSVNLTNRLEKLPD